VIVAALYKQESEDGQFVLRTIDRSRLWEIQTPQVIRKELLIAGFEKVRAEKYDIINSYSHLFNSSAFIFVMRGQHALKTDTSA
jgi:2-C-methyl-D-erythritol 4-phosphate cytidylyltransferase